MESLNLVSLNKHKGHVATATQVFYVYGGFKVQ